MSNAITARRMAPLLAGLGLALFAADARAQNQVIEDTNKQLARQISDSIARRASVRLTSEAIGAATAAGTPGTSDKKSSFWFNSTYNAITADADVRVDGDQTHAEGEIDLFQASAGIDHQFGQFFAGFSTSYTRAEISASATSTTPLNANQFSTVSGISGLGATATGTTATFDGGADNFSVNPYVGYMITPYLYPLAILGYTRTEVDDSSISADTFSSDLSMNYSDRIDHWVARAKLGWRYLHVDANVPGTSTDAANVHTVYAGATVGYKTGIFLPYFMAQYERLATKIEVPSNVQGISPDYNFLYLTGGVDIDAMPDLTLGVAGQVEAVNSLTNSYSGIFNLRFRF